jgi:hypothetical protein
MAFQVPEKDQWAADRLLSGLKGDKNGGLIAVQMGAAKPFRRWGEGRFSEVIDTLLSRGKRVVLLGTDNEMDLAVYVLNRSHRGDDIINLVGQTSIKVLGGVLKRCECLITGDTGTMHAAAAVGTPTLSIFFGTAYPWETGPYGNGHGVLYSDVPCAPCLRPDQCESGHRCRHMITPAHVIRALEIMSSTWNGAANPGLWRREEVRLLVTRVVPGRGQDLIPADEWSNERRPMPDRGQRREEKIAVAGEISNVLEQEWILDSYYGGDRETFMEGLTEQLDQLSWLFRMGKGQGRYGEESQQQILDILNHVLSQGSDALRSADVARLADLVRYEFDPLFKMLRGTGVPREQRDKD